MTPQTDLVEVVECPACGSHGFRKIGREAGGFEVRVGERIFYQPPYAVHCCDVCSLYFKSPRAAGDDLGEYYGWLDFRSYDPDTLFPTDRVLLKTLADLKPESKVLDFGCGAGRILSRLAGRHVCYGVEINREARANASGKNIRIITEETLTNGREKNFDAVLLTDTYEHLAEPVPLLESLAGCLSSGGLLVMVTGLADAIRPVEWLAEFWYFRVIGHLQMLSMRHVAWLAKRLGLRVETIRRVSHYDTPISARIRQYLQTWLYRRFQLHPQSGWTRFIACIPYLNRARNWRCAPALTCGRDHLVVVFRKP